MRKEGQGEENLGKELNHSNAGGDDLIELTPARPPGVFELGFSFFELGRRVIQPEACCSEQGVSRCGSDSEETDLQT